VRTSQDGHLSEMRNVYIRLTTIPFTTAGPRIRFSTLMAERRPGSRATELTEETMNSKPGAPAVYSTVIYFSFLSRPIGGFRRLAPLRLFILLCSHLRRYGPGMGRRPKTLERIQNDEILSDAWVRSRWYRWRWDVKQGPLERGDVFGLALVVRRGVDGASHGRSLGVQA